MLRRIGLSYFNQDIANRLSRLKILNIHYNNFTGVPTALVRMTSLRNVSIIGSDNLQLSYGVLSIIARLPRLECLDLGADKTAIPGRDHPWNETSLSIFSEIAAQYPHLALSY